jgi:hypothetical protein
MLDRSRSNPGYAGVVFSITEKDAFKVSNRVKRMPSRISDFQWNVDSLGMRQPADGGELNFRASTENGSRGLESIWDEYIDEAGFVRSSLISELYAASSPSQEMVGEYARTFIVSTIPPEGKDTWFFERFEDGLPEEYTTEELLDIARSGGYLNTTLDAPEEPIPGFVAVEDDGGWVHMVIGHKAHPIYGSDPNYVLNQQTKKKLTKEQAEREHNLGLPKHGASLFNSEAIDRYAVGEWEEPEPSARYLATLDPNMAGEDFWHFLLFRVDCYPIRLVFDYHENLMLPSHCRQKTRDAMERYGYSNITMLVIEKNNGGLSQAEAFATECPLLTVEVVNTSGISKIVNTDRIANVLTDGDVIYPKDWVGVQQMRKFSKKDREGVRSSDDAIMSWAVGFAKLDEAMESHRDAERIAAALRAMS